MDLPEMILASGGSSEGSTGLAALLFLAGPAAAWGVWSWIYARYRNRSARYKPEDVVQHKVANLASDDAYIRRIQTGRSTVEGRNDREPHQRAAYVRVLEAEIEAPPEDQVTHPSGEESEQT